MAGPRAASFPASSSPSAPIPATTLCACPRRTVASENSAWGLQEGERRTLDVSLAPSRESAREQPARPGRRWPKVLGVVLGVLAVGAVVTVVVVRRSGDGTPALPADFLGTSEALLAF